MLRSGEEPARIYRRLSDEQPDQGFWFLVGNTPPDFMLTLVDSKIALAARLRALRSFVPLFERGMASRCSAHLSHPDEAANPLKTSTRRHRARRCPQAADIVDEFVAPRTDRLRGTSQEWFGFIAPSGSSAARPKPCPTFGVRQGPGEGARRGSGEPPHSLQKKFRALLSVRTGGFEVAGFHN
jgi:hypothetical protein